MSSSASSGVTLSSAALPPAPATLPQRIVSIDALRGFVMFTMIFVNDLAGGGEIVPDWMVHFSDRHKGGSGMTFVDLVFPAFLFIVGMSIPIALSGWLAKGEPVWKLLLHVVVRTASLLALGILMVNAGSANTKAMDNFPKSSWHVSMYLAALLTFCSASPRGIEMGPVKKRAWQLVTWALRLIGVASLIWLAYIFRDARGRPLMSLSPFSVKTQWYGILGLIGWAYLIASLVFLAFRANHTALLGCVILLLCLFAADRKGQFEGFWLSYAVGIGEALGSLASISVAGVLLGTILLTPATSTVKARTQFTLLFIAGFSAAAMLLTRQWGISKNNATPSWCLWASAITAALWLLFYFVADVLRWRFISKPLAVAGENVLLAYLLSEMMEAVFSLLGWGHWYDGLNGPYLFNAIARSVGCAFFILLITAALNRVGFRLKL